MLYIHFYFFPLIKFLYCFERRKQIKSNFLIIIPILVYSKDTLLDFQQCINTHHYDFMRILPPPKGIPTKRIAAHVSTGILLAMKVAAVLVLYTCPQKTLQSNVGWPRLHTWWYSLCLSVWCAVVGVKTSGLMRVKYVVFCLIGDNIWVDLR